MRTFGEGRVFASRASGPVSYGVVYERSAAYAAATVAP